MGHPKETKWYYFYNSSTQKVFVLYGCVVLERECLFRMSSGRNISLEDVQEDKMLTTSIVGEIVSHVGAQVLVPVLPTNVVDIPVCRTSK